MVINVCLNCWKEFSAESKRFKYCCKLCKNQARYNKWKDRAEEFTKICKQCWKEFKTKFKDVELCSLDCRWKYAAIEWDKKRKATNLERYWSENLYKSEIIKEKRKKTFKEKFWWHPMQNEQIKNKFKNTMKSRHWVCYAMQNEELKNKQITTKINTSKTEWFWESICEVCKKPYIKSSTYQKYCSHECYLKYLNSSRLTWKCIDCWKAILWTSTRCCKCKAIYDFNTNEEVRNRVMSFGKYWWSKTKVNELRWDFIKQETWIEDIEYEFSLWQYRYDIRVWKFLIEINPTWTHNSSINYFKWKKPMDELYHQKKSLYAESQWYHCIHIFEWDNTSQVKSRLVWLIAKRQRLYHWEVKHISPKQAMDFYDENHLQWRCQATVHYWLFIKDKLVNAMSFTNNKWEWTLVRFASLKWYRVAHWAEKLFNTFLKEYDPDYVVSFSDITKHSWWLYNALWFQLECINRPSYWRVWNWQVYWRRDCQKKSMHRLYWFDPNYKYLENQDDPFWKQSERELMESHWYVKVCDAWMRKHIWHKKHLE